MQLVCAAAGAQPGAQGTAMADLAGPGLSILALVAAVSGWCCCRALPRRPPLGSVIVLVGMRGAGKTTLGRGVAAAMGLPFEDLDATFEATVGVSCREFVAAHGWPAFRAKELEILIAAAAGTGDAAVLAAGGGVVENAAAMVLLRAWAGATVVWVDRSIVSIVRSFGEGSGQRPWNGMHEQKLREMFATRSPLYAAVCARRYVVPEGSTPEEAVGDFKTWLEVEL
jgi:shikimate kinase